MKRLILSMFGMLFLLIADAGYAAGDFESYGLNLCSHAQYQCIPLKPGQNWASLFPDPKARDIIMRLNRTNVSLMYRSWLLVPKDLTHLNYMQLSPLPQHIPPPKESLIYVDLSVYAFGAYDAQGNLVYWGPAAGGQSWCDDLHQSCVSAAGVFRIYRKEGADCMSSEFPVQTKGGASMPYCMFYYKGFAIHGSTLKGFADLSKGCVRLFYDDAKWLYQNFVKIGTKVMVNRPAAAIAGAPAPGAPNQPGPTTGITQASAEPIATPNTAPTLSPNGSIMPSQNADQEPAQ